MKRKFIDEKGRFFGVVSVIDIIVVAIVLVLAAAVYMRFFANQESVTAADGTTFTYQIRVRTIRPEMAEMLQVGDQLYDKDTGYHIGTITAVDIEPATQNTPLADGTYVEGPVENRYDVTLDVETEGLISNGRYYAGRSYEVSVSDTLSFYSKYISNTGVIWSIG